MFKPQTALRISQWSISATVSYLQLELLEKIPGKKYLRGCSDKKGKILKSRVMYVKPHDENGHDG